MARPFPECRIASVKSLQRWRGMPFWSCPVLASNPSEYQAGVVLQLLNNTANNTATVDLARKAAHLFNLTPNVELLAKLPCTICAEVPLCRFSLGVDVCLFFLYALVYTHISTDSLNILKSPALKCYLVSHEWTIFSPMFILSYSFITVHSPSRMLIANALQSDFPFFCCQNLSDFFCVLC